MERSFVLHPEVAGGMGHLTVLDRASHPPLVTTLHYEFDDWLGDDLLETFPCFIVTRLLADALGVCGLTGFALDDVIVTTSDHFREIKPAFRLPEFRWLKPLGRPGVDDLGSATDASLVVSESALNVFRNFSIANCDVAAWNG